MALDSEPYLKLPSEKTGNSRAVEMYVREAKYVQFNTYYLSVTSIALEHFIKEVGSTVGDTTSLLGIVASNEQHGYQADWKCRLRIKGTEL
jgi:hypothetical protein